MRKEIPRMIDDGEFSWRVNELSSQLDEKELAARVVKASEAVMMQVSDEEEISELQASELLNQLISPEEKTLEQEFSRGRNDLENRLDKVVVSRHDSTKSFLEENVFDEEEEIEVIDGFADVEDVRGKLVYGNLPNHLAAEAAGVAELDLDIPPEKRGEELSKQELTEMTEGLSKYQVDSSTAEMDELREKEVDAVVTRHEGLVEVLEEKGVVDEETEVVEHAEKNDVAGETVVGKLPTGLAAETDSYFETSVDINKFYENTEYGLELHKQNEGSVEEMVEDLSNLVEKEAIDREELEGYLEEGKELDVNEIVALEFNARGTELLMTDPKRVDVQRYEEFSREDLMGLDTEMADEVPGSKEKLEETEYRDLQDLAMDLGIRANLKVEELIENIDRELQELDGKPVNGEKFSYDEEMEEKEMGRGDSSSMTMG